MTLFASRWAVLVRWAWDASYKPGGGLAPFTINRSPNGNVVGFAFLAPATPQGIAAGNSSALLVLQTPVTRYNVAVASLIDGSTASVTSFSPDGAPGTRSFAADFTGGLPPGTTLAFSGLAPGPAVSDGVLRLTEAVGEQNNMFFFDPFAGNERLVSFTATF